jgi:hypothetical protein
VVGVTLDNVYTGNRLEPEKDSEFICPRCHSRCTESPIDGTEYGHKGGCPRREIDRPSNGPSYDPEKDDLLPDQAAVADGGEGRVD